MTTLKQESSTRISGTTGKGSSKPPDVLTQEQQLAIILRELEISLRRQKYLTYAKIYDPLKPAEPGVYDWQRTFHDAGAKHPIRCLVAANQVGKTRSAAAEVAFHLMGIYPPWWRGRRFNHGVKIFCGSTTNEKSRDIVQYALLGQVGEWGTGWVAADKIIGKPKTRQAGIPDVVDKFHVKHSSGDYSTCALKCHPAGQRVLMADGQWKPIESIQVGEYVRCADGIDRIVDQRHAYLSADVMEIITRAGSIYGTPNHPVFCDRGKLRMDELFIGDVLEVADADVGRSYEEDWRVAWTALMIGDGCLRSKTPILTCAEKSILDAAVALLPDDLYLMKQGTSRPYDYKISSKLHKRNRLKESLDNDGLWGKKSHSKFIPPWVFTLCRDQRIAFLHWLWSTDGTVQPQYTRYDTSSRRLADDVRALLWSVGIRSKVCVRPPVIDRHHNRHWVELRGHERIAFEEIGKRNRDNKARVKPRPKGPKGEIVDIQYRGKQTVYGVGIPDVFELVVEGFRVGNTYEQGRESWQGTGQDVIWFDEEPPQPVFSEGITRTVATNGMIMMTFTPLLGYTEVVFNLTHAKPDSGIYVQHATWEDVPHLTEQKKKELRATYGEHEIDARSKGVIFMAGGLIFPVVDEMLYCDPFEIPHWWPRINGIDFGMDHPTAGAFCALDTEADTFYVYDCYSQSNQTPVYHAKAMKKHGDWIPCSWPRDGLQRDKGSGQALRDVYMEHDLFLLRDNAHYQDEKGEHVEPGLIEMLDYMKTSKFKVFRGTGEPFMVEKRNYHRDEKHQIVKLRDDIISAVRYAFVMRRFACTRPTTMRTGAPMAPILGRR